MTEGKQHRKTIPTFLWIIIIGILFAVALSITLMTVADRSDMASVAVYVKGTCVARLPLDLDTQKRIDTENGYNVIEIKNGRVHILEADCAEQTCVKTGWTNNGLMPIVCLPHAMIVQCENVPVDDLEPDIIAY